jgi:muramoyltetrapeptide carboxypeptidase
MLRKPRPLLPGGHIVVLAISSPSKPERIELARKHLEKAGVRVTLASNLYKTSRSYLAGSDDERLEEINHYLRSDDVDAFFFARGGYGAMRILDRIDYDAVAKNPRPIIGFSDLTALHQACAVRSRVSTFHGPMANLDFHDGLSPQNDRWFWSMLAGHAPMRYEFSESQVISGGATEGVLFGGCLSLTVALIGTPYDFWIPDGIWFWEDVDEPAYRVDRMLTHLKLSGRFKNLRGVMIGKLKACGGGDERELASLLDEFFTASNIPVVRDLPFGHHGNNLLLPIGARVRLDTQQRFFEFPEPAVAVDGGR